MNIRVQYTHTRTSHPTLLGPSLSPSGVGRASGGHLVKKPVAWPGQGKFSDRTGNGVVLVRIAGCMVYNVVSNMHDRTNEYHSARGPKRHTQSRQDTG